MHVVNAYYIWGKGSRKKVCYFSGPGKGLATKKKELFLKLEKKKFPKKMWPLSSKGGGGRPYWPGQ